MFEQHRAEKRGGIDLSRRDYVKGIGAASVLSFAGIQPAAAAPSVVEVGGAGYADGVPDDVEKTPPSPEYATENVSAPYPTNDWWSRLLTAEHAETLFSHPIFTEPTKSGLDVGYTDEWDVGGGNGVDLDGDSVTEYVDMDDTVYMPFEPDLTVGHTETNGFKESLVDGYGDWHVTFRMGESDPSMTVTQVQGSPYLYLDYAGGGTELTFSTQPDVFKERENELGVSVNGHHYGLFAPDGTSWSGVSGSTLTNDLGSEEYVTIALLPDDTTSTFDRFAQYAYNIVTDTQIDWEYVEVEQGEIVSEVRTTFEFTVEDLRGSGGTDTIAALYPHQHKYLADGEALVDDLTFESPRGTMKLSEGSSFTTALTYPGIIPHYPVMDSIADEDQLNEYAVGISTPDTSSEMFDGSYAEEYDVPTLSETDIVDWSTLAYDAGKSEPYGNTYWTGLNYNRWSEAAALLNELDMSDRRDLVLDVMKGSYEQWFRPKGDLDFDEDEFDTNMFFYDEEWGTLTGYVAGFGAYEELNDHHFHYGYFVKGASEIARYDIEWPDESVYGGMIQLLIKEFANPTRDDEMFPFLRNFSPYSGHSFASGINPFHIGNNQEASSEAVNAYQGLIRWGAFTGQKIDGTSIRDLGIFLYTHEIHAALEYWYDWEQENHPDDWEREYASLVWGGGYSHSTWWTERAEDTYAINVIPANGDKLYLGWDEEHAGAVYDELVSIKGDEKFAFWPGILTEYQAFSDPDSALDRFQDWESGNYPAGDGYYAADMSNSKLHTYTMLTALDELGSPTNEVVSDGTFSHVFVDDSGQKNYVVYNPTEETQLISFSDGTGVEVQPRSLAVERGSNDDAELPEESDSEEEDDDSDDESSTPEHVKQIAELGDGTDPDVVELSDVQQSIGYWSNNEPLPGESEPLSLTQVQDAIDYWSNNKPV
ncbi:MAG: glycosyl hydrolase [archaeon]